MNQAWRTYPAEMKIAATEYPNTPILNELAIQAPTLSPEAARRLPTRRIRFQLTNKIAIHKRSDGSPNSAATSMYRRRSANR